MRTDEIEDRVVDPVTGEELGPGQEGELCIKGPTLMLGYYNKPEETAQKIRNGWLHTGDMAVKDSDGYVRITGRLTDMIIVGGFNTYPAEIEEFLFTHPKVAQVAVFGVPDERYGEEIMAWVQLRAGESATADELRAYCIGKIAHYKVPKHIWIVEEFPMTVTGKLQKFRMREIAAEKMAAENFRAR